MTRQAVRTGFEGFVDDVVDLAYEEFDVVGALRNGTRGGGSRVVSALVKESDALDRHVVQPMLAEHKRTVLGQFDHVLDYATTPGVGFQEYAGDVLRSDMYFEALRPGLSRDEQAEIERRLLERQRRLGDALVPLVETDADAFWPAVTAAFDRDAARRFVETHFGFTDPLVEHRDAFAFTTGVDPGDVVGGMVGRGLPSIEVEYTDEAVRTLRTAETEVIGRTLDEVDRQFD